MVMVAASTQDMYKSGQGDLIALRMVMILHVAETMLAPHKKQLHIQWQGCPGREQGQGGNQCLEKRPIACIAALVYLNILSTNSCHLLLNGLHTLLAHGVQDTDLLLTQF